MLIAVRSDLTYHMPMEPQATWKIIVPTVGGIATSLVLTALILATEYRDVISRVIGHSVGIPQSALQQSSAAQLHAVAQKGWVHGFVSVILWLILLAVAYIFIKTTRSAIIDYRENQNLTEPALMRPAHHVLLKRIASVAVVSVGLVLAFVATSNLTFPIWFRILDQYVNHHFALFLLGKALLGLLGLFVNVYLALRLIQAAFLYV